MIYPGFNLAASTFVGPSGFFGTSSSTIGAGRRHRLWIRAGTTFVDSSAGYFNSGTTGFVGIRLASGNYGWIRLRVDDLGLNQPFTDLNGGTPVADGQGFPDQITVIDWAYEDSGAAIHVGDTGTASVPEPSPLALLAAGAVGIGAFRRRQAQRTAA